MSRLELHGVQTRPIWRLNHLQKPYKNYQSYKVESSIGQVKTSLCLPSSPKLKDNEIDFITDILDKK